MKYQVIISGDVTVKVEATDRADAEEKALQTPIGGEVANYVIEDVLEVSE